MSAPHPHTNRLIHESSPYLRQHAHNPVDWYAWGDDAFAAAKRDGKPILLSIGYSACHWCHVMERESFEDEDTARVMNEHFVNIKVDREERPDVDHIYMTAVQMLTGHGGWPLTVFLTPDGKPFYGGTYFPPEDRHGLPAFRRLLLGLAQAYRDKPGEVEETVRQIMAGLMRAEGTSAAGELSASLVTDAANTLARAYDDSYGGLGRAPKFPNEAVFDLFLRTHHATGDERWLEMVLHTLRQMARGGIYDQLGGGFHRYSVDERWLVPHFEKMLYDNAQLVPLYLSAYQITGDRFFADIAAEVLDYVEREMRDAGGGFYSTQDADSEGEEGKFFVWTPAEVAQLVGADDAEIVCRYWDVTDGGNFEHRNILHVTLELDKLARFYRRDAEEVRRVVADAKAKMFAAREQRVKPGRDDKILTAWNGLMISAFAKGAEVLGEPRYRQTAAAAVAFVEQTLQRGDRLLSTYKDGVAKLNGYLDDYAFFAAALLDVFELVQDRRYLERARKISDTMITHFWDEEAGGFFFTSDDHEVLITRSKPAFDGSIPSGTSVAARTLLRLHHYTEHASYLQRAETILGMYTGQMKEQPFGFANLLCAVDWYTRGAREIAVVGDPGAAQPLLERIRRTYLPNRTLLVSDPAKPAPMPSLLAGKTAVGGQPTVYVCHNMTCSAPVTTWEALEPLLRGTGSA